MIEKQKQTIDCPVCNTKVEFGVRFCRECGWLFEYFAAEISDAYKEEYAERLEVVKNSRVNHQPDQEMKQRLQQLDVSVTTLKTYFTLKTGDYLYFGKYYGQPILWRVIHRDEDGDPLLFTEYILTYKPFDAARIGKYGEGNNDREKYGSNNWQNSCLRKWLNSAEEKVNYSSLATPSKKAVFKEMNAYAEEPGFLRDFSKEEQRAIKPVEHKVMIAEEDQELRKGGTQVYELCQHSVICIQEVMGNFEAGYYMLVTDQVLLLSPREIKEYVSDKGKDSRTIPTPEASLHDEFDKEEYPYYYWTCCPAGPLPSYVWRAGKKSETEEINFQATNSAVGIGGVRPALYLNLAVVNLTPGGLGTKAKPYQVISL